MAMAVSTFGRLRYVKADSAERLSRRVKLRVYITYIVSVLTWGLLAWRLGDIEQRKLAGWNFRRGRATVDVGAALRPGGDAEILARSLQSGLIDRTPAACLVVLP